MDKFCYQKRTEQTIFIDLPGGLRLKGVLRGSLDRPLVIMLHGLPGYGNELLQYLGSKYLSEQGFATFRAFLYAYDKRTRDLADCTVDIHAADLDVVVDYFREKGVEKIFAEGHSYGGLTILRSKSRLDGAVLWDPAHGLAFVDGDDYYSRIEQAGPYKLYLDGDGYIEPEAITKEQAAFGDNSLDAKGKGYPIRIVSAGDGVMTEMHKKYLTVADQPSDQVVIDGAHHQFEDSDEVMWGLLEATREWLESL